jgi:hypothetical protein
MFGGKDPKVLTIFTGVFDEKGDLVIYTAPQ